LGPKKAASEVEPEQVREAQTGRACRIRTSSQSSTLARIGSFLGSCS